MVVSTFTVLVNWTLQFEVLESPLPQIYSSFPSIKVIRMKWLSQMIIDLEVAVSI